MSERWPGGIVRSTPVTPTGPLQNGTAPGIWTVEQAAYWTKQGLWPTAGNFLAVEDVFSTWLYTGAGSSSSQTITNGIDLSGKGGLVWEKARNGVGNHFLFDTVRGGNVSLASNTTSAQASGLGVTFNSSGYTYAASWATDTNVASWTFREAPKFFDVVTYTGTGSATTIAHNLGSAPGCIIVKRTDTTANWAVYHRGNTSAAYYEKLNLTDAQASDSTVWNSTNPTSSVFSVGTSALTNASGGTYVAYLFAHDTSSTGIIQCGSYTGNGLNAGPTITLGWEPQWVMIKNASATGNWTMLDTMRGMPVEAGSNYLRANSTAAEGGGAYPTALSATGFQIVNTSNPDVNDTGNTYIYIAIRRGPMRTPTSGTSVFSPITGSTVSGVQTTGFAIDLQMARKRSVVYTDSFVTVDRLRGVSTISTSTNSPVLVTRSTAAEVTATNLTNSWSNTGFTSPTEFSGSGDTPIFYNFRRAPSFFDEVCYTGTGGSALTLNHNLGVAPELVIFKMRSNTSSWVTLYSFTSTTEGVAYLNLTNAGNVDTYANHGYLTGAPTASQINLRASSFVGQIGQTYVAYLFASCPGVSKVGSYTGTGALQTINCGFTTGARFVLIKRTDSTGDWYVWDSARGISSGNDPYLLMNSTAAEVTGTNYVDTDTTGFQVTAAAPAGINASGGSYIFLAVA